MTRTSGINPKFDAREVHMRATSVIGLALAIASAGVSAVAQTPPPTLQLPPPVTLQTPPAQMWLTIGGSQIGGGSGSIPVSQSAIYVDDGPAAFVGAPLSMLPMALPARQAAVAGLSFGIRAWKEGEKARVVVFAALEDKRAPNGRTETPIATFMIAPGQSIEVPQTESWGASRVYVSAALR
jgi:hypothetical protein